MNSEPSPHAIPGLCDRSIKEWVGIWHERLSHLIRIVAKCTRFYRVPAVIAVQARSLGRTTSAFAAVYVSPPRKPLPVFGCAHDRVSWGEWRCYMHSTVRSVAPDVLHRLAAWPISPVLLEFVPTATCLHECRTRGYTCFPQNRALCAPDRPHTYVFLRTKLRSRPLHAYIVRLSTVDSVPRSPTSLDSAFLAD